MKNRDPTPLCKCGCGKLVSWSDELKCWNSWRRGHNSRSMWKNSTYREKALLGMLKSSKDPIRSQTLSKKLKVVWSDPEFRERMLHVLQVSQTPEVRSKIQSTKKRRAADPEFRERMRLINKDVWKDPILLEQQRKISESLWRDPEYREKTQLALVASWKDPSVKLRRLRSVIYCPNKLELYFDEHTPDSVLFVGDSSFWVTLPNGKHKNPDFLVTGQRKVIEIYGDYWHRNDDPFVLIEMFHRIGYECLILWENEIRCDLDNMLILVDSFIGEDI